MAIRRNPLQKICRKMEIWQVCFPTVFYFKTLVKEVYNSRHIWHLFNHFTKDIKRLMTDEQFAFRAELEEFVSNQMAKVIREFLASKFWDATTIAGDSVNEDYFRHLAAVYVEYCKKNRITFKTKPHIAEMLRIMQQKIKIARVEVRVGK